MRDGVSKTTVYRRWASNQGVVLAAAGALSESAQSPDNGSVRDDLEGFRMDSPPSTPRAERGSSGLSLQKPRATKPSRLPRRSGFLTARRQAARVALEQGIHRGGIQPGTDRQLAVDQLAAPFQPTT